MELTGTSLSPSRPALGTWAIQTICAPLNRGMTLIDAAATCGQGRSEKIVGKAVAGWGRRDRVLLATKVGLAWHRCEYRD